MPERDEQPFIFSDLALARRLERAEAHTNAEFIETRARLSPESGARWIEVAGAYAMYDGAASLLTQTFGLGLWQETTDAELDTIESFFQERGAPCSTKSARWPTPRCWRNSTSAVISPSS